MTVVDPIGKLCPLKKLLFTEGVEVQLSVAVGAVQFAIALVPVVVKLMFWGHAESIGLVISVSQGLIVIFVITISKLHVELLFLASVAV